MRARIILHPKCSEKLPYKNDGVLAGNFPKTSYKIPESCLMGVAQINLTIFNSEKDDSFFFSKLNVHSFFDES